MKDEKLEEIQRKSIFIDRLEDKLNEFENLRNNHYLEVTFQAPGIEIYAPYSWTGLDANKILESAISGLKKNIEKERIELKNLT